MDISKVTINLLRKRLKKQKRRTYLMFIFGLFLGCAAAFSLYYWYPTLEDEFNLQPIKQVATQKKQESSQTTTSSSIEVAEKDTDEKKEDNLYVPRITFQNPVKISAVNQSLNEQIEQTISPYDVSGTILAIKDNQIALLKNYGNASETSTDPIKSTYMMASVQKAITAILVMKLIEDNKLTLDTPLSTFYKDIPNSNNITIDQMLSMTSGLQLEKMPNNTKSKEEAIQYVLQNVTYEEPTKWRYSTVNFFILAAIIEKITNKSYEEFFNETIKKPLNLKHIGFYSDVANDTDSQLIPSHYRKEDGTLESGIAPISEANYINELGTGNMYTSVGDLATIIQARVDGDIISSDILKKTLELQPTTYAYTYKAGFYQSDGFDSGHGLFRGYEPSIYFNNNANTMVIFLSNAYTSSDSSKSQNMTCANSIFELLNQY